MKLVRKSGYSKSDDSSRNFQYWPESLVSYQNNTFIIMMMGGTYKLKIAPNSELIVTKIVINFKSDTKVDTN